jgi:hypothetical protein
MIRETIVEEVTKILHGPIGGNGEELEKNPLDFYSVGVLFPRLGKISDISDPYPETNEEIDEQEGELISQNETPIDEERAKRRRAAMEFDESDSGEFELTTKFRPSAAGISVLTTKNANLNLTINFATYIKKQIDKTVIKFDEPKIIKIYVYKHFPKEFSFRSQNGELDFGILIPERNGKVVFVDVDENVRLYITTRSYPRNEKLEIKTFTLINVKEVASFRNQKKPEDCIFQPVISINLNEGFQPFEDLTDLSLLSPEDVNLKLLYRNYKKYALGHGVSVNWNETNKLVQKVFTQVLPEERVNGVDLNPEIFKNKDVLYVKRLSGLAISDNYIWQDIEKELKDFVSLYDFWIEEQFIQIEQNVELLPLELVEKAKENLKKCKGLSDRMIKGIEIFANNPNARKAFEDANRAMFMQRVMANFSSHRRKENRVQHNENLFDDSLPVYSKIPFDSTSGEIWLDGALNLDADKNRKGTLARWRPFQLAFLLSQLEGIVDPASDDRDTVDLIWFPTGGGKTEAYLGLTAFTIFYRRLNAKKNSGNPDAGAGVTVLMRYTLRLLNKQQFERASVIICACDLIRRTESANYGQVRISNGIWMGRSMTPNKEKDQWEDYGNYIRQINRSQQPDTFKNSPPLLSCPCCGNRLVREVVNNQVIGRWGYFREKNNRNIESGRYLMACTNTKCDFHLGAASARQNREKLLPIFEVDETIYNERPSLLFSTVDKFVQLAWKSECFNLFNIEFSEGNVKRIYPAPELIIQDELHLISSALGTIYGVYEIVVDKLCKEAGGNISKIIGATATVRNAEQQCKRLYGRKYFLQFPPPATNADDSFYAKKMSDDPKNRLYVGFMPSGVTTSTALIRLASVLLERIPALILSNEEVDKHYTLVVYFNALKELGKFRTFLSDDIVAYRKLLANHFHTFIKPYNNNTLCELSSVMNADDITKGLDRLEKTTLPLGLDLNNKLLKKIFQLGLRTYSDIQAVKTTKGQVWKSVLITKKLFDETDLPFVDDYDKDYKTFIKAIDKLIPEQQDPIHIAPATNMISVGVDIPRLNTMIVNGQPKTSAEYIQASSRVGREDAGVVYTFLAPTKNRDRSHYENFKAFHQAYYCFVESTSVTPFSGPALEKVLPTVFIALTRSLYLNGNKEAFSPKEIKYLNFMDETTKAIKTRSNNIYGKAEASEISITIDRIKDVFLKMLNNLSGERKLAEYLDFLKYDYITGGMEPVVSNHMAVYNAPSQFTESILNDHIPTMQTLRNVESSTKVSIKS